MRKKQTVFVLAVSLFLLGSVFVLLQNTATGYAAEGSTVYLPLVSANYRPLPTPPPDAYDWPMAGANVERTSWVSEEIRGSLKPEWYTHFDAYISQKVQIVAAAGFLYISAADGLHALDAENGVEIWFYPTELPLGHSPTYYNGVVYVGGMDKMIHAIDALTGNRLWTFEAGAGFHTNPLVVNGVLYAGNRDSYFYAIHTEGAQAGQLAWKYKTGAPILYSAAYKDSVVFFASNDMHAYALDAQNGNLVWKSAKLPGYGFHSFWPVVYRDYVVFSGSWNYRLVRPLLSGMSGNHNAMERDEVFPQDAVHEVL
jgi:outer membrane protein assembly factor BamB